jgi:hypothetical protein
MRKEDAAAKWLREHAAAGLRRQQARQRGRALEWARKRAPPFVFRPSERRRSPCRTNSLMAAAA